MDTPLIVFVRFTAKPGQEDALRQALVPVVEPTREEEGNLFCDLHQGAGQPGVFVLHEGWRGVEALTAHMAAPYVLTAAAAMQPLLALPADEVRTYRIGGEPEESGRVQPPFPPQELVSPHGAA